MTDAAKIDPVDGMSTVPSREHAVVDAAHGGEGTVRAWVKAIDEFTAWSRAAGNSPRTIEQRRYQLAFLAEAHLHRTPWRVTTSELAGWLGSYDWSAATRYSYRSTIRTFYAWAQTVGHVKRNPAVDLPPVRVPQSLPRPTPDGIVDHALDDCTDRDRLFVLLATHAGLRRAEIASLRWEHVGTDELRITGKGNKIRSIPLHPRLAAELTAERVRRDDAEYGSGYRYRKVSDGGYIFPSRRNGTPISPHTVGTVLSKLLGPQWTGHTLRHRFGTRTYQISGDIRITAALLGHARLDTTAGYARIPDDALRRVVDQI